MKYDKLVRDNIPSIIENDNKKAIIRYVDDIEKKDYLLKKLQEEVDEFVLSNEPSEIADILEVIDTLISNLKLDKNEIYKIKEEKRRKNGGFEKNIILVEVKDK